jgi:hypothetical protein
LLVFLVSGEKVRILYGGTTEKDEAASKTFPVIARMFIVEKREALWWRVDRS